MDDEQKLVHGVLELERVEEEWDGRHVELELELWVHGEVLLLLLWDEELGMEQAVEVGEQVVQEDPNGHTKDMAGGCDNRDKCCAVLARNELLDDENDEV